MWEAIQHLVAARLASKAAKTKSFSDAPKSGTLWIVATPIGDLMDITLKALWVLADVDVIACEDTRVSKKLLTHYGIHKPLVAYHDHNAKTMTPLLLERLEKGQKIALISDAGTPMLSDPGHSIVQAAWQNGIEIQCAPGASAVGAALMLSGVVEDHFAFQGFLPSRGKDRKESLHQLQILTEPFILYEAPHRFYATMEDLLETLGDRPCVVCRELTKLHQSVYHTNLADAVAAKSIPEKGEFVLIIMPAAPDDTTIERPDFDDPIVTQIAQALLAHHRPTDVAKWLGHLLNQPNKEMYQKLLKMKNIE